MILQEATIIVQCDLCKRELEPIKIRHRHGFSYRDIEKEVLPSGWGERQQPQGNGVTYTYLCCGLCQDVKLPDLPARERTDAP